MISFFAVILGLQCVLGALGSCPNPEVVQNFNASAYLGKWYEQAKYPILFEEFGTCITAEYSLRSDGLVKVFNSMIRFGSASTIEGTAAVNSTTGEAKLAVTFDFGFTSVTSPYWVVDTDYTSYSVVYSCSDEYGTMSAWILTREQNVSDELIENAYSVFKKGGLSTDKLTKTDQENC